jgi:hypothetical protein
VGAICILQGGVSVGGGGGGERQSGRHGPGMLRASTAYAVLAVRFHGILYQSATALLKTNETGLY